MRLHPRYLALGNTLLDNISLHPGNIQTLSKLHWHSRASAQALPTIRSTVTIASNNGYSTYHAAQLTMTKRSSHGLTFIAAYTWAKNLTTSDTSGPDTSAPGGRDFFNRAADYSVTEYHIPPRLQT